MRVDHRTILARPLAPVTGFSAPARPSAATGPPASPAQGQRPPGPVHTARAGLRTLVLDSAPAPCTATSDASFSRATAFGKEPGPYFDLNHAGLRELRRLHRDGTPGFHPCPSLVWSPDAERTAALARTARERGYTAACAPALSTEPAPGVVPRPPPPALTHLPDEGWVDLPALGAWSLDRARQHGAQLMFSTQVTRVLTDDRAVTGVELADASTVSADAVVNAAGARADRIAATVGVHLPLSPTPGLLADLPLPGGIGAMVLSPRVSIRPHGPDAVRVRSEEVDSRLGTAPPTGRERAELLADLVDRAASAVPALHGARPLDARTGVRVMPADGLSAVGPRTALPGYHEAVTHSGATLGPLLGRLVAGELATGQRPRMLIPYTPDRFTPRHQPGHPAATAHQ